MGDTACRRWSVTGLCCLINFVHMGLYRMSGMLFPEMMQRYNVGRSNAVLPFALCISLRNLSGPIVSLLGKRYGLRCVTFCGNLLSAIAFAACFIVEDIASFSVLYGGIHGIGFGLGTVLLPELLTEYFDDRLSVANGIIMGGPCLAGFILPLVVDNLLAFYGISGTMLLLSGLVLQTVPASLLLWSPKKKYKKSKLFLNSIDKVNDDAKNSTETVLAVSSLPDISTTADVNNELKPRPTSFSNYENAQIQVPGYENLVMENHNEDSLKHSMRMVDNYSQEVHFKSSNLSVEHKDSSSERKYNSKDPCLNTLHVIYCTEGENDNLSNSTNFPNPNNNHQEQTFEISTQETRDRNYDPNHDLSCDIKAKSNDILKYDGHKDNFAEVHTQKLNSDSGHLSSVSMSYSNKDHIQKDLRFPVERKENNPQKSSDKNENNKSVKNKNLFACISPNTFALFSDLAILFLIFSHSLSMSVFLYLSTIVIDFARDCGVRNGIEVSILMAMAVSDAVGRFFLGFVTDCGLLTSAQFFALCMAIASAMFLILTLFNSFETILICCTVYGLFHGATCSIHVKFCAENVEKDDLSMTLASRSLLNIPFYLLQPMLIGFFRDTHKSYKGLIIVFAIVCLACCVTSYFTPWASRRRKKKQKIGTSLAPK